MKTILAMSVMVGVVCGCATVSDREKGPGDSPAPVAVDAPLPPYAVGMPIAKVLKDAEGLRVEYFAADGTLVDALPEATAQESSDPAVDSLGSVSVHRKAPMGQDNYTVGKDGVIQKHLRSYGADYAPGVWTKAE